MLYDESSFCHISLQANSTFISLLNVTFSTQFKFLRKDTMGILLLCLFVQVVEASVCYEHISSYLFEYEGGVHKVLCRALHFAFMCNEI